MEKLMPNLKFVGHFTEVIWQSKIKGSLNEAVWNQVSCYMFQFTTLSFILFLLLLCINPNFKERQWSYEKSNIIPNKLWVLNFWSTIQFLQHNVVCIYTTSKFMILIFKFKKPESLRDQYILDFFLMLFFQMLEN